MFRHQCIQFCQDYHEYVHLTLGVISVYLVFFIFPEYSIVKLFIAGLIGSMIPDIDHLFYLFIYGRSDKYASQVRSLLYQKKYNAAVEYCRTHHKENFFILSHNLLTPLLIIPLFYFFVVNLRPALSVFALAIISHFVFDIFEDLLVNRHLNPNWFLKFSRN